MYMYEFAGTAVFPNNSMNWSSLFRPSGEAGRAITIRMLLQKEVLRMFPVLCIRILRFINNLLSIEKVLCI